MRSRRCIVLTQCSSSKHAFKSFVGFIIIKLDVLVISTSFSHCSVNTSYPSHNMMTQTDAITMFCITVRIILVD